MMQIATHEAGHSIGLGHSAHTEAAMSAKAHESDTKGNTLLQDDIDAATKLYPRTVTNNKAPEITSENPAIRCSFSIEMI